VNFFLLLLFQPYACQQCEKSISNVVADRRDRDHDHDQTWILDSKFIRIFQVALFLYSLENSHTTCFICRDRCMTTLHCIPRGPCDHDSTDL
jgi:hypothetical protein